MPIYKTRGTLRNRPGSPYNRTEAAGRVWLPGKNRRCPLQEEGLPEVEPSSPPPSAESPRLPQPGRTPAPFRSNTGKDAAGCAASYLGIPAAPHHRLQTAERAAAPTGLPDPESGRSTARKQKTADGAEAMAATELRRRQKRRLHPKRCENHASCRKAKFFSYFCAIIIGKR